MKKRISTGIMLLVFVTGLSLLLYPGVSNFWNSIHQTYAIVDYEASLKGLLPVDYSAYLEEAEAYNQELAELEEPLKNYDQIDGYETALDVRDNGMMGYITVPRIEVELPIYHGTSESVLSKAAGHLEGSSLPVGGSGTHCVISAHRGLPSARLFTSLDEMEVGDTFSMKILDRLLTYEVYEINIVKPEDIEKLSIQAEEDLCTLVTCTPYGINSHRLLVQGKRTESAEEMQPVLETETKMQLPGQKLLLGAAAVTAALMLCMLRRQRKRKRACENSKNG